MRPRLKSALFLGLLLLVMLSSCGFGDLPVLVEEGVVYSTSKQKMNICLPEDTQKREKTAVIFVHGGAWVIGDRINMMGHCQWFAKHGHVSASIDYRLAPNNHHPDAVYDVREAVRYFQTHATQYGIDADRVVIAGSSAGGHLVLMAALDGSGEGNANKATRPVKVAGVISVAGPTDLTRPDACVLCEQHVRSYLDDARATDVSPVNYASADDPPVLLIHGKQDPTVRFAQAEVMVEALRKANVPVTLLTFKYNGHELAYALVENVSYSRRMMKSMLRFVEGL